MWKNNETERGKRRHCVNGIFTAALGYAGRVFLYSQVRYSWKRVSQLKIIAIDFITKFKAFCYSYSRRIECSTLMRFKLFFYDYREYTLSESHITEISGDVAGDAFVEIDETHLILRRNSRGKFKRKNRWVIVAIYRLTKIVRLVLARNRPATVLLRFNQTHVYKCETLLADMWEVIAIFRV